MDSICNTHTNINIYNMYVKQRVHCFPLSLFNLFFPNLQMSKLRKNRKRQVTDSSDSQNKTADWHKGLSDVHEKLLHMLDHSMHTDCTFVVGLNDEDTQEFKAHRILLCTASEVFERMLMGEMKEALTGHVRITDITPSTFHLLLR
jgi:hypothetical protein